VVSANNKLDLFKYHEKVKELVAKGRELTEKTLLN